MIITGWDETVFAEIAKKSGSRQAQVDVRFMRAVNYRNPKNVIALRLDDIAMAAGYANKRDVRIVVVAVDENHKRKGIGRILVKEVLKIAQRRHAKKVWTKTNDGYIFYRAIGFSAVGREGEEYIMEKKI